MRHAILTCTVILTILILFKTMSVLAKESRGLNVVSVMDKRGKQVGLYKGSYALLIGISDYVSGWPDLESIAGELEKVESALVKKRIQGCKGPESDK